MKIDRLVLGDFETNCYVVRANGTAVDCLVIDTGLDTAEPSRFIRSHNFNPVAIILTHGHVDHIAGVDTLRARFGGMKVYIHKLDAELLTDSVANLSFMAGQSFDVAAADCIVENGDLINEAGMELRVLHTPGHTPGGICLYAQKDGVVFVGDTLFAESVGRTDFPNGNMRQLIQGIKEKLLVLPGETAVYPGHGPATTIGREKANNPFLHQPEQ